MTETFATTVERLREIVDHQIEGYRRLLESTREGTRALQSQDPDAFDRVLEEQVETLRSLKELEWERGHLMREVGDGSWTEGISDLESNLRRLADEVGRAARVSRMAFERNGELVTARLSIHERAGVKPSARPGVDRIA